MITIKESVTNKLPGNTSLFVGFSYNKNMVDAIKTLSTAEFDKKTSLWEVPVTSLADLLDCLCVFDDITLQTLPDDPEPEFINYELFPYKTPPFPYQQEGIQYGLNHDSFLLLDQPGLGKSLQSIYLALERKNRDNIEHCLIVCGVNTLKYNWKSEIEKHTDLSCRILGQRINRKGKLVIGNMQQRIAQLREPIEEFFIITNIETLRNADIVKELLSEKSNKIEMCILDEIHHIKDPTSQQGHNLLKLNKFKYKIGMTGTLLLNTVLDCYVPLKWIGAERSTYSNFKYYYCNYGGPFHNILTGYKNIRILKQSLDENSIRRTKSILNLPPKVIIDEFVDMNDAQDALYQDVKQGVITSTDKINLNLTSVLSLVGRLRQVTACPSMLTTSPIRSAKIDRCEDLVEQICSDGVSKVVIFSAYKETARVLCEELAPYNPLLCTGDVPDEEIAENVYQFQNSDVNKVMVCTEAKLGTGVTLNRANNVIFIDTPYTNAEYEQCQDRCHRIGSNNKVTIYNLICKYSIDERVSEIVKDKEMLSDYVIDSNIPTKVFDRLKSLISELE